MTTTTHLGITLLEQSQAAKEVTVNAAFMRIDAVLNSGAKDKDLSTPPGSPATGDVYIVAASPTGDWSGHANHIAYFDQIWRFITPNEGMMLWVNDEDAHYTYNGSAWAAAGMGMVNLASGVTGTLPVANGGTGQTSYTNGQLLIGNTTGNTLTKATLTGTANEMTVTNGAGSITLSLPSALTFTGKTVTGGTLTGLSNAYIGGGAIIAEKFGVTQSDSGANAAVLYASHASYAGYLARWAAQRAGNSAYSFLVLESGGFGTDIEFNLRGDGNGYCDGSWTGGGADYAEFFEWMDGNPTAEDRRGVSVVLTSGKIRPATAEDGAESIIGVVSANPTVVGDAAWNRWSEKYQRDAFGAYVLDETGARVLNPAFNPALPYTPRALRPEWGCVGLMGKLRLHTGQPIGDRWIKLRDIAEGVEEWLVR